MWTIDGVNERAKKWVGAFSTISKGIPYESKGILFQEAFFLYACLADRPPLRLIESGRARGQSTLMLGLCFPESTVASIEFDSSSGDVPIAEQRLAGLGNVHMLYGDARSMIPTMLKQGDIVVIDGPKEHRALALAYRVLESGLCPAVFIHDCYQGSPIRRLLDDSYPSAFYSDDPTFVSAYRHLDEERPEALWNATEDGWRPHHFVGHSQVSWGPTYACLPYDASFSYRLAGVRVLLAQKCWQLRRSLAKRFGRERMEE